MREVKTPARPGDMVGAFDNSAEYEQVQAALKQSEARFRGLTELSSDWYWEQDEHYRFLKLHGEYVSMTGLPEDAYVGLTRWEIDTVNMTELDWQAHRADLKARKTFRDFEICRINPEGTKYWISVSGAPIVDDQGVFRGYRGVGRNITDRRRLDAELQDTGEKLERYSQLLQLTLDNMGQGICKMEPDGHISIFNQKALELLDLPKSLMAAQPSRADVARFQLGRGDFIEEPALAGALTQRYVVGDDIPSPGNYTRKTRTGTTIEVRTTSTPDGGFVRTYTDVSSYIDTQAALRQSESRFRALVELSSDWYWEQDADFRFIRFDGDWRNAGLPHEHSDGKTRREMGALNLTDADWAAHQAVLDAHETFRYFEVKRAAPDGTTYWVSVSGGPIFDAAGKFTGYRGVGSNITERKRTEDQIERLAFYDVLTELPNRRMLIERLNQAMIASTRSQQYAALLFIDLDNFKTLNDTHGHDMGDQLLQRVAARLRASVREVDTVARLGGDEFVVMIEELSHDEAYSAAQVKMVAEKIIVSLNHVYALPGQAHHSTPSIGITLFLGARDSSDELLKRADIAMYQAKAAGRNTVRFFDPAMQAAAAARSELEVALRQGIPRDELVLYYQPVVDVDRVTTGVEALVRWQHPALGLILPGEFIELAEQTGLILPLGRWVLRAACMQLVAWAARPDRALLTMAVNVSERQIRQPDFVAEVLEVVTQTGANPYRLKLEITESLLLTDTEDIIVKMAQLKAQGVSFSLDDFGTGYSSLSYLKRLPLDQLKIDQSFVRDVLTDPNDAVIALMILALAISLGLDVVAEGVESEGQLAFLTGSGCKAFQGYLFSRPVPLSILEATLGK
jgi:diguanylate cyclase (GGDEF)-like protein/PAS domain S-box-containing protein